MKYKDLIQFEPIESVIVLKDANNKDKAEDLVKTFVVSQSMEINLNEIIIPNLQFEIPQDQKGIFVVGNYGTGKSHLMAFISALAENQEYLEFVNNQNVKKHAQRIAGKFKVIRYELGGTSISLRDAVCDNLEKKLKELEIEFNFPPIDKIGNNKDSLYEMMDIFQEKYPNDGLLFIVDELLDFLKGREDDQKLIMDLGFLREIGEVCKNSRFRFVTGVQESLFESPSFKFAADTLGHVSERFTQATIQKEDVRFVVSERLLKKTPEQKAKIREHLEKFHIFYKPLSNSMETYVDLFPVHEQFFDKFKMVNIGEQRKILEAISKKIQSIIEIEVPENETGIFSYDSYWDDIKNNHINRVNLDVRKVIEITDRVAAILEESFEGSEEKLHIALRIIDALAIHRLTTGDLKAAVGLTAENLKDELFLCLSNVPVKDENFLLVILQKILKDIMITLNSLYIRLNEENRHYYIYTDIGPDPNQEIKNKASKLSTDKELSRYYFDLLSIIMEQADATIVSGFKIWEYQLMWHQKKVEIDGYLFFGNPNERSTAHPPREYYMYFIEPFRKSSVVSSGKDDEVFIQLKGVDDFFEENLRNYAAARELSLSSTQEYKKVYNEIAQKYEKSLLSWFNDNISDKIQITYKNSTKLSKSWSSSINIRELSGISGSETLSFKQQIDTIASGLFSDYFLEQKPDYPSFSIKITNQNRRQTVQEALKGLIKGQMTGQARAILTALDLLSGEGLTIEHSSVCQNIISAISAKASGMVVNRNELVERKHERDFILGTSLEIEFLPVFFAAMIHEGIINLSLGSDRITASNLESLLSVSFNQILDFNNIKKAEEFPIIELKELFTVLKLRPGLIVQESTRKDAIKDLKERTDSLLKNCANTEQKIRTGFTLWEQSLLSENKKQKYLDTLFMAKGFLETANRYDTPAKMINFKKSVDDIKSFKDDLEILHEIEKLENFVQEFQSLSFYLGKAEGEVSDGNQWKTDYLELRASFINSISINEPWNSSDARNTLKTELQKLKDSYKHNYLEMHKHFRLGPKAQERKVSLQQDIRLENLRALSTIDIIPDLQLRNWENALAALKQCTLLTSSDLDVSVKCPHCSFILGSVKVGESSADQQLNELEAQLEEIEKNWKITLRENMEDPTVEANFDLISDQDAVNDIKSFISGNDLPESISPSLLQVIKDVLKGLDKVSVDKAELFSALNLNGLPVTPMELKERFQTFLNSKVAGREEKQIRIVIEE